MTTEKRCGNCRWFDTEFRMRASVGLGGDTPQLPGDPGQTIVVGKCHINPPVVLSVNGGRVTGGWPPTNERGWCGEWEKARK